MRNTLFFILFLLAFTSFGQRRITPVTTNATMTQSINEVKNDSIDRRNIVEMRDSEGKIVLVDTVTGKEFVDSAALKKKKEVIHPLLHSAIIGIDIWNPAMKLFGQDYGLIGFSAQVNLKNKYIPTFEFGLGNANYKPDDNNYTFHAPISPYFKIGLDYNFMYNSNPDYLAFAGIRYGFSPFNYQLKEVSVGSDYWGENNTIDFPEQSYTAGWLELSFGIRAKIWSDISLGWTFKYHSKIHKTKSDMGEPWYIPGYGTSGSNIAASFSVYYTLPVWTNKKHKRPTGADPESDISTNENITPTPAEQNPSITADSENTEKTQ